MDEKENVEISKAGGDVVFLQPEQSDGKTECVGGGTDGVAEPTSKQLPAFVEGESGQALSPILASNGASRVHIDSKNGSAGVEVEIIEDLISSDGGLVPTATTSITTFKVGEKDAEAARKKEKNNKRTLELAVNVGTRNQSPDCSDSHGEERIQEFKPGDDIDPVKVKIAYPTDLTVTCKATLLKLDEDEGYAVEPTETKTAALREQIGEEVADIDDEFEEVGTEDEEPVRREEGDVIDCVRGHLDKYKEMREQYLMEQQVFEKLGLKRKPDHLENNDKQVEQKLAVKFGATSSSDSEEEASRNIKRIQNNTSPYPTIQPVIAHGSRRSFRRMKHWPSNTSLKVSYDPNEKHATGNGLFSASGKGKKALVGTVGTAKCKAGCCCTKGHICFDCFPIPDQLLEDLHGQTGMSRLMCLQAAQTVVKYYRKDLLNSSYFAFEAAEEDGSEYSEEIDETALLLMSPLSKPPKVSATKDVGLTKLDPIVTPKLSEVDKCRKYIQRLKKEPIVKWTDSQNVSFVFTFFRKLNKVMATLDRSVLKKLMYEDDYEFVWILAKLLRRESLAWSLQWEILGVLSIISSRDIRARKKLLESNFPVYLSSAILDPESEPSKLGAYAELLTVLFTTGKSLPIYLMEHFGLSFVVSVLDMIENDDSRPGWALPDVLVKLLLAYNLQFSVTDVYDNLTILAIARVGICKTLTSRLIDWLDHKDGPLTSWEVSVSVHQCVIKMVTDIFLCRTTSHIFSVSQAILLMRLLTKSLPNFMAGDKRRTSYLKLIQAILRHCKYDYIRNTPCLNNLESILLESSSPSLRDQDVIRSIFKEFPQLKQDVY